MLTGVLLLSAATASGQPEEGLVLHYTFDAKRGELTALCDLSRITSLSGRPILSVVLRDARQNLIQEKTAPIPRETSVVPVKFSSASLISGLYEVSVSVKEAQDKKVLVEPAIVCWYLPEVAQLAGAPPGRKILNNLVTQLAAVNNLALKDYQEVSFINPRKGWVFVSTTAQVGGCGLITIGVDAEKKNAAVVHLVTDKPTMETMRLLSAGEHKLCIWADFVDYQGKPYVGEITPVMTQLVVRAVPAMMYCGWPGGPYVAGYGEYDFKFLTRDVLPNINTFVGGAYPRWEPEQAEWKKRGGQCLLEQGMPDRMADAPRPLTGDYAYKYWTESPGFMHPSMDGVVVDEFGGGDSPNFLGYIEAVKRVAANPAFKDRVVHVWCDSSMPSRSLSRDFTRVVIDSGYKLAWETYLAEAPTAEEARAMFEEAPKTQYELSLRLEMEKWQQAFPDFAQHAILVLAIASAPPWTVNINPSVDYKVFLDMQYQYLAASPEFLGLWGVMIYKASYADEETLRWAGRLFRHYCIEGNTDLLSDRYGFTYNLRYIRNPDFNEGLTGWQSDAAEPGSVKTGNMRDLHTLMGRYYGHGPNEGNNFLLMKRFGQKPNRVSQEIVGLQAGRLYSMKMLVADYQDLLKAKSEKKRMAVSVNIKNVEMIPAKSFVSDTRGQSIEQYDGKPAPFTNYHRLVFRAKRPTARLTISDWADPSTGSGQTTPGGPVGQETLVNFIEIQPYLED